MAAPSPALAPAQPQCPLPILLRDAGGHRARCPPSQLGLRLPLTASPSHHAALVPDAKSISGEGCFTRDGQPVAQTLRGQGGSRDGGTAGPPLQVQSRGDVPSLGRGTLLQHRRAWDNGCAGCPGPGITQYCLFFSYVHLHETPASKGISKQWGG